MREQFVKFTLIDEIKRSVIEAEMVVNEFVRLVYLLQLEHGLHLDRNESTGVFEVIVLGD